MVQHGKGGLGNTIPESFSIPRNPFIRGYGNDDLVKVSPDPGGRKFFFLAGNGQQVGLNIGNFHKLPPDFILGDLPLLYALLLPDRRIFLAQTGSRPDPQNAVGLQNLPGAKPHPNPVAVAGVAECC